MNHLKRFLVALVVGLFVVSMSENVYAQSIEELEEENQELRDEIDLLTETIITLEEQITSLEEMLESQSESESDADSEEVEKDGFTIGDEVEVDGVTLRIEDAYYTDERNSLDDSEVDQVIMIEIYYENNTGDDYSPAFDFDVYFDGKKADTYPVGDIILETVSNGRNASGTLAFGIMGDPETIELEYSPLFNMFTDSEIVIIDVTPE